MSIFKRFLNLIKKDSKFENESRRVLVMLRWIYLVYGCYFLIFQLLLYQGTPHRFSWLGMFTLAVMGVAFICTYHFRIKVNVIISTAAQLVWIISFVYLYGWDCGVQHFIFVLLVLIYFSTYDTLAVKIASTVFLFLLRLGMFIYCRTFAPIVPLSSSFTVILQCCNSMFLFIQLGILCGTFSSNIESAEKKLVEYNKRLEQQASTDPLTGLWNRRTMLNYIQNYQEQNPNASFAIAMGDIDHFKWINDQHGHDCGDAVLVWLAGLFRDTFQKKGKFCRWGGEEFLFFFPNMNGDEAHAAVSEFWILLGRSFYTWHDEKKQITMTFGLEENDYHSNLDDLIKRVDEKLYIGKEKGRNRIIY